MTGNTMTTKHRIFTTAFARVYPMYIQKAERKGRRYVGRNNIAPH